MKKRMNRKLKKIISKYNVVLLFLFILIPLFFFSTGYALLQKKLELKGESKVENIKKDTITDLCGLEIKKEITNQWGENPFDGQVKITLINNNDRDITSWMLKIPHYSELDHIYLNTKNIIVEDTLIASNLSWNTKIEAHSSLELFVGIGLSNHSSISIENVLKEITLASCGPGDGSYGTITNGNTSIVLSPNEEEIEGTVSFLSNEGWIDTYKLTITNKTNKNIIGWKGIIYFGAENAPNFNSATTNYSNFNWQTYKLELSDTILLNPGASTDYILTMRTTKETKDLDKIFVGITI